MNDLLLLLVHSFFKVRIAWQINKAFSVDIDKDVVTRRIVGLVMLPVVICRQR